MNRKKPLLPLIGILLLTCALLLGWAAVAWAGTGSLVQDTLGNTILTDGAEKACSGLAAGREATPDGSTLCCYTSDGRCDFRLEVIPAATHAPGSVYKIEYTGVAGGFAHDAVGEIPQVAHTYQWFKAEVPFANEHQVFISENTCGSREELATMAYEDALMDWHTLVALALQRSATAAEAVDVIGALVEQYGLRGDAESYLVTDPDEVWIVEIVGNSNIWAAQRIPDNAVTFHANRLRLQEIDFNDTENFRYAPNLKSWPEEKGFYDPAKDGAFSFEKVYSTGRDSYYNARREWRAYSLLCPSKAWDPCAVTYPVYVIPEQKVSAAWCMQALFRDVMEGTAYSLSEGVAAGPFGNPARQSIEGVATERPISTWTVTYATVCQARGWMPDAVGGLIWYCNDTPRTSVWTPIYCGVTELPLSWRSGDYTTAGADSAWWVFQTIESLTAIRYNEMHADIRAVFDKIEAEQLANQAALEEQARDIYRQQGRAKMIEFLTAYSNQQCRLAEQTGRELIPALLAKYRDGSPRTQVTDAWKELLKQTDPTTYTTTNYNVQY